jgi:hypothetical protein
VKEAVNTTELRREKNTTRRIWEKIRIWRELLARREEFVEDRIW